jgi:CspA family cold shock protein
MGRETGFVKWFSREKGYGFVRRENGDEVFVHHSDIQGNGFRSLRQGEKVEFEIEGSDRGPRVRRLVQLQESQGAEEQRSGKPSEGGRRRGGRRQRSTEGGRRARPGEGGSERSSRTDDAPVTDSRKMTLAEQIRAKLGGRFPGFRS